jgi:hypothetical protein
MESSLYTSVNFLAIFLFPNQRSLVRWPSNAFKAYRLAGITRTPPSSNSLRIHHPYAKKGDNLACPLSPPYGLSIYCV